MKLHNTLASERPVRFSDIFKRPFEVDEKAMTLMASQLDNQTSRDCGDNHSQTFSFSFTALKISAEGGRCALLKEESHSSP